MFFGAGLSEVREIGPPSFEETHRMAAAFNADQDVLCKANEAMGVGNFGH